MVNRLWEILTTLTEETQKAVIAKCNELGYKLDRADIMLDEAFINLNIIRAVLIDAIEKNKLSQLPLSIQKTLLGHLESIQRFQTNLMAGSDEVVNLVNSIEGLYTAVWQYGLHNLSEEVLGYQTKLNQLKNLELEIIKLKEELNSGLAQKIKLDQLLNETQKASETIKTNLSNSEESTKKISDNLTHTNEVDQEAAAKLASIRQYDEVASRHLASITTNDGNVTALETKIREFHSEIEHHRNKMINTSETASTTIEDYKNKTNELVTSLQDIEKQIKDQLQKATGITLFHSFQKRKEDIVNSKKFWTKAIGFIIALAIAWSFWLSFSTEDFNIAFYLKLSISLPLIYALTFCTVQYSHERKLEEEYAFKSNISLSLIPYKDLVEKIVKNDTPAEKEKYAAFIIESINNIFTSPTDKVFDHPKKEKGLSNKALKQLLSVLEPVIKAIK